MKHIVEFNLPEDKAEYNEYLQSSDAISAHDHVIQFIRANLKYETKYKTVEECLEALRAELNEFDILI